MTLLEWPEPTAAAGGSLLRLERLPPDREDRLRALLPAEEAGAWRSACQLLTWVCTLWRHDPWHAAPEADALDLVERAGHGERFRCVEFTRVLVAALNARAAPARPANLMQSDYHSGIGKGHVAVEAWIDDLGRWVLLDAQNGAYWEDETGPLSALDLWRRRRAGEDPAAFRTPGGAEAEGAEHWWRHFAHVAVGGVHVVEGDFEVSFQGTRPLGAHLLLRDPAPLYPSLAAVDVGVRGVEGVPGIELRSAHPYATGFHVDGQVLAAVPGTWVLRFDPGEHAHRVGAITPYGRLATSTVRYRVAPASQ